MPPLLDGQKVLVFLSGPGQRSPRKCVRAGGDFKEDETKLHVLLEGRERSERCCYRENGLAAS